MMKKMIALSLTLMMAFAFAACGSKPPADETSDGQSQIGGQMR
jgi:predicted small lipoprotein YifL